jgi:hypothetical protein
MINSYFQSIRLAPFALLLDLDSVAKHDIADLFDLIWFRLGAFGLNIDYFFEVRHGENMVIAPDALLEAQAPEEAAEPLEGDIRVPFPGENVLKKLLVTVHIAYLTLFIDFFGTTSRLYGFR